MDCKPKALTLEIENYDTVECSFASITNDYSCEFKNKKSFIELGNK